MKQNQANSVAIGSVKRTVYKFRMLYGLVASAFNQLFIVHCATSIDGRVLNVDIMGACD